MNLWSPESEALINHLIHVSCCGREGVCFSRTRERDGVGGPAVQPHIPLLFSDLGPHLGSFPIWWCKFILRVVLGVLYYLLNSIQGKHTLCCGVDGFQRTKAKLLEWLHHHLFYSISLLVKEIKMYIVCQFQLLVILHCTKYLCIFTDMLFPGLYTRPSIPFLFTLIHSF